MKKWIFGSKSKKLEKNYLRIYANLTKNEYSESEKKLFVEKITQITDELYNSTKLKYDIIGAGYGISKGGPLIGKRAFRNRFLKKGYKNLFGISIYSEHQIYKSGFFILDKRSFRSCFELYFSWPNDEDKQLNQAIKILKQLSEVTDLRYGYAYPTDNKLYESLEGKTRNRFFSFSVFVPKDIQDWNENIGAIEDGKIKKLHEINLLNSIQRDHLKGVIPDEKIVINDELEIWRIKSDNLITMNSLANNRIVE